jgi:hypothetical protein
MGGHGEADRHGLGELRAMTDLAVRAVMTGDAAGLVSAAKQGSQALDGVTASARNLSVVNGGLSASGEKAGAAMASTNREAIGLEHSLFMLSSGTGFQIAQFSQLARGATGLAERIGVVNLGIGALMATISYAGTQSGAFAAAWENTGNRVTSVWQRMMAVAKELDYATSGSHFRAEIEKYNAEQLPFAPDAGTMKQIADAAKEDEKAKAINDQIYGHYDKAASTLSDRTYQQQLQAQKEAAKLALASPTDQAVLGSLGLTADSDAVQLALSVSRQMRESDTKLLDNFKPQGLSTAPGNAYEAFNGPYELSPAAEKRDEKSGAADFYVDRIKVEADANTKIAGGRQALADQLRQIGVREADDFRRGFDQMGASAILNFRNAGDAAMQFADQLENLALQKAVLGPLGDALFGPAGSTLGGSLGGFISSFLGIGGSGAADASLSDVALLATGAFHTGGMIGDTHTAHRYLHPAYFDHAPRAHGGMLLPGERPIIAQDGEGVFTPRQMDNADALLTAAMAAPKIVVIINEAPGTKATVQQSTGSNGDLQIEVMIDQVDSALADRQARGKSQFGRMIEGNYGLRRSPS